MIQELGTDEKYLAIQELKEKIQTARDAIRHASSDLSRLEDIENKKFPFLSNLTKKTSLSVFLPTN